MSRPRSASRWFVYMVRCRDGSLYTGATTDVTARVARHNAGTGARYTRSRRPVTLVWWRRAASRSAALSREARLKQLTRAEKWSLVQAAGLEARAGRQAASRSAAPVKRGRRAARLLVQPAGLEARAGGRENRARHG